MRLPPLCSPRAGATSATTQRNERTTLPHFSASNGELHGPASPRLKHAREAENALKTPIDLAIDGIRDVTAKIKTSFARMHQTEEAFDHECHELRVWIERIQQEQEQIAQAYVTLFHLSAIHVQRVFRGFLARRLFCEAVALRAVIKIQRVFRVNQARRAERRRKFRILCKKVLRGMKGIRARHNLTRNELLNRVSHNMMIERQWRMAMGITDTESDMLHALYRRRFVRQRLARLFRNVTTMHGIIHFWRHLVPPSLAKEETEDVNPPRVDPLDLTLEFDNTADDNDHALDADQASQSKPSLFSVAQQLSSPSKQPKTNKKDKRPTQEELRAKQKLYTQRVYEENLKKETARAAQVEKQQELARQAEEARKIHEDQQRRIRLEQAQALREDLERRGLLAIKELQSKKEEELRKEEEARQRIAHAKQRIAQEVLSDETQLLLTRKLRGSDTVTKRKT